MKMLPRDYAKAVGTPFRVEKYKDATLEMYYLNDRNDFHKFAQRGRFSVWTSDGVNYRLFVEKGYYEAVPNLYKNEVNDIWLDFTNSIYGAQRKMSRKYMMVSMIVLLVVLGASMLLQTFWAEQANNIFLAAMVVLFIGLFVSSNGQQKRLRSLVQEENKKATELIKNELGEAAFQEILDNQEKYYQKYFNTEEEIETPIESNDEQEALEAFQEDEKADVEDKE
ncbi:MAG TPA: hypothetical protein GX698_04470 [Acholeplasmataceae bacterium]|nr:hypothetical protein [Acholeplasmataceae bacterium]